MDLLHRNCSEKIIFCIDLCNEMENLDFRPTLNKLVVPSRLELIKAALRMFVHTKQKMNPNHEFAICVLLEDATWFQDFTSDIEIFSKKLQILQSQGDFQTFNLTSLFKILKDKIPEILNINNTRTTTESVYRTIFVYSRSNTVPHMTEESQKEIQEILNSPIFFFDVLYLHSKPSKENKPQEVYDMLTNLNNERDIFYFYENSSSIRRLQLNVASLLSHPFQREEQSKNISKLEC